MLLTLWYWYYLKLQIFGYFWKWFISEICFVWDIDIYTRFYIQEVINYKLTTSGPFHWGTLTFWVAEVQNRVIRMLKSRLRLVWLSTRPFLSCQLPNKKVWGLSKSAVLNATVYKINTIFASLQPISPKKFYEFTKSRKESLELRKVRVSKTARGGFSSVRNKFAHGIISCNDTSPEWELKEGEW